MMEKIAIFHSPLKEKFGIPRQAGLAPSLEGTVVFEPPYNKPEALKGLEGFDYIWIIWGFHLNEKQDKTSLSVRPPRLGGNTLMGVFATRSPFRPNGMGLSSVRLTGVDVNKGVLTVCGADLADGTPIYDIKPYIAYTDSHPEAKSGFVDENPWKELSVIIPAEIAARLGHEKTAVLKEILSQDPRPKYQNDPSRQYGLNFDRFDVIFCVDLESACVRVLTLNDVDEA